jgi:hypothetical protein
MFLYCSNLLRTALVGHRVGSSRPYVTVRLFTYLKTHPASDRSTLMLKCWQTSHIGYQPKMWILIVNAIQRCQQTGGCVEKNTAARKGKIKNEIMLQAAKGRLLPVFVFQTLIRLSQNNMPPNTSVTLNNGNFL